MRLKKLYNEEKHYFKFFLVAGLTWGLITYFHLPSFFLLFVFLLDGILTSWSYFNLRRQLFVYGFVWGLFLYLTATPAGWLLWVEHLGALFLGWLFDRYFAQIAQDHCNLRRAHEHAFYEQQEPDPTIFANSSIFEESKMPQPVVNPHCNYSNHPNHPKVIPFKHK